MDFVNRVNVNDLAPEKTFVKKQDVKAVMDEKIPTIEKASQGSKACKAVFPLAT